LSCTFTPYQDDALSTSTKKPPYARMNEVILSSFTLKDLRLREGITQHEVATALNIRSQTVSLWERGIKEPYLSFRQTTTLCKLYNCKLEDLLEAFDETAKTVNNDRVLVGCK
jgi:DNA-binding XRE family transcriptional regulator